VHNKMKSLIDYLTYWTELQPDKCVNSFLDINGEKKDAYSYAELYLQSGKVAGYLSNAIGLQYGDRVLLSYPPGLDILVAFLACVRMGVIPVPVPPPTLKGESAVLKQAYVAQDCEARAVLTSRELWHSSQLLFTKHQAAMPSPNWVNTNEVADDASSDFRERRNPILFLQYTSGSTSDPKGVIVSHENVIHNASSTIDHVPIGVSWLPQYHDMGLIGYYLFTIICGGTTYGFSPFDFLKRPILWLETISKVRATYSSSPNFGFEYCLRKHKIPPEQLCRLDLSSLRVLMNAAEPVCPKTYRGFLDRFAPYGLRPEAHVVAYGLAENTLAATHFGRRIVKVSNMLLQQGTIHIEKDQVTRDEQVSLSSCGKPLKGIGLRIVDPQTATVLGERQIGEVWLSGKSSCRGYWRRPQLTREVFRNTVNDPEDSRRYLRTGDLGFLHEGELFICGRLKDLIIINGVNCYPSEIEAIVEASCNKVRTHGVAAFNGDLEVESLVVMAEVRTRRDVPEAAEIARAIRSQYHVAPHTIVLVAPGAIVRTTSGKIARSATRQKWLMGELPIIATHICEAGDPVDGQTGLQARFRYLTKAYDQSDGHELSLSEIGFDSLMLVRLLSDTKDLLQENGAADLVEEVNIQLLQQLTVSDFFWLLDQFEKNPARAKPAWQSILTRAQSEYDSRLAKVMWSSATGEPIYSSPLSPPQHQVTNVLMTGPTGFLGPFLLNSLLRLTDHTYYVLTRAPDARQGMKRIKESLRRSRLWTADLAKSVETRVKVLCGDIAKPYLGLGHDQWNWLAGNMDAVWHNAATVNYVLSYEAMRACNVDGTGELLRFACTARPKYFHHMSTTFIFGWSAQGTLLESNSNDEMANLDFGYSQTKWVAEQQVARAGKHGLKTHVYRPALISASTQGVWDNNDIALRLLAFMINHEIAVYSRNQLSFLPADIVAHNIVSISKDPTTVSPTLHITADDYYNMTDITRLITAEYGYRFAYFDVPEFVAEMNRRCGRDNPLYPLLDFFNRSYAKIAAMELKRYNNDEYRKARRRCGDWRPDPPLKDTISYLIAHLRAEALIS